MLCSPSSTISIFGRACGFSPVIRSSLLHLLLISIILCGNRSSCRLDELKTTSTLKYWNFSTQSSLQKEPVSVTLKNFFATAESFSTPSTTPAQIIIVPTSAESQIKTKENVLFDESANLMETLVGSKILETTSTCEENREPTTVEVGQVVKEEEVPVATLVLDPLPASPAITLSTSQDEASAAVVTQTAENELAAPKNDTLAEPKELSNQTVEPDKLATPDTEAMPSFDEWKRKKQAEQKEGEKAVLTTGQPVGVVGGTGTISGNVATAGVPVVKKVVVNQKRRRNYASYECGAKVLASNREAEGAGRILNEQMDEYMLNPCKAKIWFVIELCDTIQTSQLELANFELFSSLPKEFIVSSSDQYPSRDWTPLGTFTAQDQRTLHSFQLLQQGYGKFLKVEFLSHYGKEHYCPLSVVRVFGTSMVDEFEDLEATGNVFPPMGDEDERPVIPSATQNEVPNAFFGSAKEVVMTFVRKAAEALGRDNSIAASENNATPDSNLSLKSQLQGNMFLDSQQKLKEVGLSECDNRSLNQLHRAALGCGFCPSPAPLVHSNKCRFMWALFNVSSIQNFCEHTPCQSELNVKCNVTEATKLQPMDQSVVGSVGTSVTSSENTKFTSSGFTDTVQLDSSRESVQNTVDPSNATEITEPVRTDSVPHVPVTNVEIVSTSSESLAASLQSSIIEPLLSSADSVPTQAFEGVTGNMTTAEMTEEGIAEVQATFEEENQMRGGGRNEQINIPVSSTQKESVFVRLNNRIRLLEVNLTLSSQYLQELSQRYRRQMEDMQRAFNRTVGALNQTAIKAAERDRQQQMALAALQKQMENITSSLEKLRSQNRMLYKEVLETHIFLIAVEAIVVITFLTLCWRRYRIRNPSSVTSSAEAFFEDDAVPTGEARTPLKRHHSVCDLVHYNSTKKRRPSESVSTAGTYSDLMIVEPAIPIYIEQPHKARKRHRNRKNRGNLARSISNPNLSCQKVTMNGRSGPLSPISNPAAGVLFFPTSQEPNENCENCSPDEVDGNSQAKVPFQNLTNPRVKKDESAGACKEHFSLKKLLKFSKKGAI